VRASAPGCAARRRSPRAARVRPARPARTPSARRRAARSPGAAALFPLAEERSHVALAAVQVVDAVHPARPRRALEPVVEPLVEVHGPVLLVLAVAQTVLLAV